MKLKPIEPGCIALCLTTGHGLAGSEVKVIEAIPPQKIVKDAREGVWWVCESARIAAICAERKIGGLAVEEAYLMRIDGSEPTMDDLTAYDTRQDRTFYVRVRKDAPVVKIVPFSTDSFIRKPE